MAGDKAIAAAQARPDFAFILKRAALSALVAFALFFFMIGIRTDAGSDGSLTWWTRFDDLAIVVAVVFVGSIIVGAGIKIWRAVVPFIRRADEVFATILGRDGTRSLDDRLDTIEHAKELPWGAGV